MKFSSQIVVNYPPDQVWDFLIDPFNMEKWDKNVEKVIFNGSPEVGAVFHTISPAVSGKKQHKMSYKVIEIVPFKSIKTELIQKKIFKKAVWIFSIQDWETQTLLKCKAIIKLKLNYFYIFPYLLLVKRKQFTDIENFAKAMDNILK